MSMDKARIGDDLVIHFPEARNALRQVIDLTGATLYCSLRRHGESTTIAASATSIDVPGTAGKCRAVFYAAVTASFVDGAKYEYDGVVRLTTGEIHTVGEGDFLAAARVTPQPA